MLWVVIVLCAYFAVPGSCQTADEKIVTIVGQGSLRGFKAPNHDVFQFLDVPYASAPMGPNKFKAPQAPPIWMGTLNAVDRGIMCPQVAASGFTRNAFGQEDCLVANIYVPNTNETNLPVLVIVHGGAFIVGWGQMVVPNDISSSRNIIVVSFNYRLGPHGFLCLGTEDAPGNAGMRDQVALLQWVQNNIASFGGNRDNVTIYGCSAGGSAVDLLALSPMTDGLFNKVIAESGCSMNAFSTQINPLQNARDHAQHLGFVNVTDLDALAEFYKTTPIHDLFDQDLMLNKQSYFVFQPCVENDLGQPRFLADAPLNILKSGNYKKLPTIYGYSEYEGLFRRPQFDEWSIDMNQNFADYLPANLQFDDEAQRLAAAQEIKNFYFGNNTIDQNTVLEFFNYFSDVLFVTGILRSVKLQVQGGNDQIYLYEYTFTYNGSTPIPYTNGLYGADHCDQFMLILDDEEPGTAPQEKTDLQANMREIIYNFIITGNPTPSGSNPALPVWPPAGANRAPHYSVGDNITIGGIPTGNRAGFWDSIYERYAAIPQRPVENPEVDPTPPVATTPGETETTPEEVKTTEELVWTTTTVSTSEEEEEEDNIDPDDIDPTTPQPDSATQSNVFSLPFWILHASIVLFVLK